jgi:hypothetical protein
LKTGKAIRKQEKDVRKHVAYTLNFTYTEQNTKFTIGFGMMGKLRVKSPCVPQNRQFLKNATLRMAIIGKS